MTTETLNAVFEHGTFRLIAATGLGHGLIVVTNNEKHYQRITGIQLENWLV